MKLSHREHNLFIEKALQSNLNFFAIRKPQEDSVSFGASARLLPNSNMPGFVIASFLHHNSYDLIPFDITETTEIDLCQPKTSTTLSFHADTARDVHRYGVVNIVNELRAFGEGKTVLSRVRAIKKARSIPEIFDSLAEAYPYATIFCYRTSKHGMWIGATPELLLSFRSGEIMTMSLAGTRKAGESDSWDAKNREEQQIVTDFICNTFRQNEITVMCGEPETVTAGPVEHIRTIIKGSADASNSNTMMRLALQLSPTPALSGYPRTNALNMIHRYESHDRGCYGGFLGLIEQEGDMSLYVNLRSARIFGDEALLYAGGGITRFSDADSEWEETELKLSTLEAFFE